MRARAAGVDVITGEGLSEALTGVDAVIDTAAARNLQEVGARAGVRRLVAVSIIGADRFTAGYGAAKIAQEQGTLAGPIPARVLRTGDAHAARRRPHGGRGAGRLRHGPRLRVHARIPRRHPRDRRPARGAWSRRRGS